MKLRLPGGCGVRVGFDARASDAAGAGEVRPSDCRSARGSRRSRRAFTIIELLLAMAIFSMVIMAIHSTWTAILRASKVGADTAANLQRARVAARALQEALASAVMFQANQALYTFEADTSGQFAALSFVARLPLSYIGGGYFGDQVVRRVTFVVEPDDTGVPRLLLTQKPLLQTNIAQGEAYTLALAREVNMFALEFFDPRQREGWVTEWTLTNQMPKQVRFALAFGKPSVAGIDPRDVTVRTVDIPSSPVPIAVQGALPAPAGPANRPNQVPQPGGGSPNAPGGGFDPRWRPGGGG
jgi:prepilin-type N-terminal cleavage/methylation domain-containing protein